MKQYNIDFWNNYEKPNDEVTAIAIPGDLVVEIGGVLYLVQRKNEMNNIVCFRIEESDMSILTSFIILRKWLIAQNIIYIRVEGTTKRYNFLKRLNVAAGYDVIQDLSKTDRNLFYIKLI